MASKATIACLFGVLSVSCSSSAPSEVSAESDASTDTAVAVDTAVVPDEGAELDGGVDVIVDAPPVDDLSSNRDRLLGTYYDYLKSSVTKPQTNGLSGSTVSSVCDLWKKLVPSSQATYLTLTARMQQSVLRTDSASMLSHVVKLYRLVGGEGATATDAGSCGGGEFNRLMLSMDPVLQASLRAAADHKGSKQSDGKFDISDLGTLSFWRDSHDAAGAHDPFDATDETEQGAPRGQTQYFRDPTSEKAKAPLGRKDLETLVDPFALEIDQDYDCVHASNPSCTYVTYGPACFPEESKTGIAIYTSRYGSIDPTWKPKDCSP